MTRGSWNGGYDATVERRKAAAAERRRALDKIKLIVGCMKCGYRKHPAALQFDHRNPANKKFNVGNSSTRNWQTMLGEIAKCDILCANCHAEKTWS